MGRKVRCQSGPLLKRKGVTGEGRETQSKDGKGVSEKGLSSPSTYFQECQLRV